MPDTLLPSYVDVLGETLAPHLLGALCLKPLRIHSLGSYILKNPQTRLIFGELYHVGEVQTCGVEVTRMPDARILYLDVDASFIALPPGFEDTFNPFFEQIRLPVAGIEEIGAM